MNFRIRKLPKALKDWQAFIDLKKTIDDFNESCPLLEMMSNKAMKPRHWERISTVTKHPLEIESETFQLRNLMDAPLLKYKEDIEVGSVRPKVLNASLHDDKACIFTSQSRLIIFCMLI